VQGEVQQQLDVLCNTIMLRAFCGSSSSIHSVASEEEDEPRCCSDVMVCRITLLLFCEEVFRCMAGIGFLISCIVLFCFAHRRIPPLP
jgi:hypothetical protein